MVQVSVIILLVVEEVEGGLLVTPIAGKLKRDGWAVVPMSDSAFLVGAADTISCP